MISKVLEPSYVNVVLESSMPTVVEELIVESTLYKDSSEGTVTYILLPLRIGYDIPIDTLS